MAGEREIEIRRMMQHFEHQIAEMNSEAISKIAGDIKQSDFLGLAQAISILRAQYLKDVMQIAHADKENLNHNICEQVKLSRIAYEEAVKSFDHLKHALQRGYFNLIED